MPRLLLPSLAPLGRPADHRRLGLPVDRAGQLRPRLLDRPGGCWPPASLGGHRPDRRRPDPGAAGPAARQPGRAAVVVDGGYDSAQLTLDLAEAPAAVLVRLRSDRCFYADPPPRPAGSTGRPRRHGAKFNCADPTTWPTPTATLIGQDDQYGAVTVQAWSKLPPKQQRHPGHGTGRPRPIVRGTIIRVQVERVPARTRPPKVLWLWWAGPGSVDLDLAWRAYIRRFDLEIVCTQVTKPRPGAARGGGNHVADLHLAVGDHHPVDQQLHQLAALFEAGLAQAHAKLLQHLGHRLGDAAHLDQPLPLGGDLPLTRPQVRLLLAEGPVLPLEGVQVDHLGQVGLQQPLPLAGHARPDAA